MKCITTYRCLLRSLKIVNIISLIFLFVCLINPNYAHPDQVYKWVDENGVIHFSNSLTDEKVLQQHNVQMKRMHNYESNNKEEKTQEKAGNGLRPIDGNDLPSSEEDADIGPPGDNPRFQGDYKIEMQEHEKKLEKQRKKLEQIEKREKRQQEYRDRMEQENRTRMERRKKARERQRSFTTRHINLNRDYEEKEKQMREYESQVKAYEAKQKETEKHNAKVRKQNEEIRQYNAEQEAMAEAEAKAQLDRSNVDRHSDRKPYLEHLPNNDPRARQKYHRPPPRR